MLKPEALRPHLAEARPQSEAFGRGAPGGPVLRHPAPAGSTKPRAPCPGFAEASVLKPEALRPPLAEAPSVRSVWPRGARRACASAPSACREHQTQGPVPWVC